MKQINIKTPTHLVIALWAFAGVAAISLVPFIISNYDQYQKNMHLPSLREAVMAGAGLVALSSVFGYAFYHLRKLYKANIWASARIASDEDALDTQHRMLAIIKEQTNHENAVKLLMEEAADLLDVRFAGIGLFDATHHLRALEHYDTKNQQHSKGFVYAHERYALLIKAMTLGATVPIDDIHADTRTLTLVQDFPEKKTVQAVLYAPLRIEGAIAGACWFEAEEVRRWALVENRLAAFAAEMVAYALVKSRWQKEESKLSVISHQFQAIKNKSDWGMARFAVNPPIPLKNPLTEQLKALLQHTQLVEGNASFGKIFHLAGKAPAKLNEFLIGKPDLLLLDFLSHQFSLTNKEFLVSDGQGIKRFVRGNLVGVVENEHLTDCWLMVIDVTEQKVSEQYYRQITESASNMMTILDKENRIMFDSDSVIHTLGYEKETRINQHILTYLHHDETDLLTELLQRAWQQLSPQHFASLRFRHKDGNYFSGDGALVPVKRNDVFTGMMLEFRLNEERKEMEKILQKQASFFKGLAESSEEVIAVLDKHANILYENQAMEIIFGYKQNYRIGRYGLEYIHPDDVQEVDRLFRLSIENPHVHYQTEIQFRHARGEWKNALVHFQNELDNDDVQGIIFRMSDITEQWADRKNQEKEAEIFKTLVQHSPNSYLILDEKGIIRFASEETQQILGYTPQEIESRNFVKLIRPEDKNAALDNLRALQNSPDLRVEFQSSLQKEDGEWRQMQIAGKMMFQEDKFLGILLELEDISEQSKKIAQLNEKVAFNQALNDSSGCIILLVEVDGTVLYLNPTAENKTTIQVAQNLKNYIFPDNWKELLSVFEQLEDNPTQRNYLEIKVMDNEGDWQPFYVICTHATLRSSVKGILLEMVYSNVWNKSLQAAMEPEWKEIVTSMPQSMIFQLDLEGNIICCEGNIPTLTNYSPEDIRNTPFSQYLDKSSKESLQQILSEANYLQADKNFKKDVRVQPFVFKRKENNLVWLDSFVFQIPTQKGLWILLQNASNRREQAQELRNQRWINDQSTELLAVVEANGTIRFANDSFHKVFNLYEGENIYGIVNSLEKPEYKEEFEQLLKDSLEMMDKTLEFEPMVRLNNGKHLFLKCYLQNMLELEPIHALLFRAVDFTELFITKKDLEGEIEDLKAELVELTERVGQSYQKEVESLKEQLKIVKEQAISQLWNVERTYRQEIDDSTNKNEHISENMRIYYEKELKAQELSHDKKVLLLNQRMKEQEASFKVNMRLEKTRFESQIANKEKQIQEYQEKIAKSEQILKSLQHALSSYDWQSSKGKLSEASLSACLPNLEKYHNSVEFLLEKLTDLKALIKLYEEIGQTSAFSNVFKHIHEFQRKIHFNQMWFELLEKEGSLRESFKKLKSDTNHITKLALYNNNDRSSQIIIKEYFESLIKIYPSQPHQIMYEIDIENDFMCFTTVGDFTQIVIEILSLLIYAIKETGKIQIIQWQEEEGKGLLFKAISPSKTYRRPEILLKKADFYEEILPSQSIPLIALKETLEEASISLNIQFSSEEGIEFKIDLKKLIKEGEIVQRQDLI
jgi:PAS domain S-box-containing protein